MNWNLLNEPIEKMRAEEVEAEKKQELAEIVSRGEEKKQRVLRFLESNSAWPVEEIVKKFDLAHDVKKDFGNGIVQIAFFSDESRLVECFDLEMDYKEVLEKLR